MTRFGETHLILFAATVLFLALSMLLISKLPRRAQTVMFILGALVCAVGIFFRYGFAFKWGGPIHWQTLGLQMMQVCNFNLILVLLMLVPKFEQARQYSIFFSMFAASTTLVSLPSVWANLNWWDLEVLNSWINHTFAIALPLWMLAARRLKPQKKYVVPTLCCVAVYFSAVYVCSEMLIGKGIMTPENSYSFVYTTDGIGVFEILWSVIPQPFFYLVPLAPALYGFFWLLAKAFERYEVLPFNGIPEETEEEDAEGYEYEYEYEDGEDYEEEYDEEEGNEEECVDEEPAASVPVTETPVHVAPMVQTEPAASVQPKATAPVRPAQPVRPVSGATLRPNYAPRPAADEEVSMVEQAGMAE